MSVALKVYIFGLCLSQVIGQSVIEESCDAAHGCDDVSDIASFLATDTRMIDKMAEQQGRQQIAAQDTEEQDRYEQSPLGNSPLADLLKANGLNTTITRPQQRKVYRDIKKALNTAQNALTKRFQEILKSQTKQLQAALKAKTKVKAAKKR